MIDCNTQCAQALYHCQLNVWWDVLLDDCMWITVRVTTTWQKLRFDLLNLQEQDCRNSGQWWTLIWTCHTGQLEWASCRECLDLLICSTQWPPLELTATSCRTCGAIRWRPLTRIWTGPGRCTITYHLGNIPLHSATSGSRDPVPPGTHRAPIRPEEAGNLSRGSDGRWTRSWCGPRLSGNCLPTRIPMFTTQISAKCSVCTHFIFMGDRSKKTLRTFSRKGKSSASIDLEIDRRAASFSSRGIHDLLEQKFR